MMDWLLDNVLWLIAVLAVFGVFYGLFWHKTDDQADDTPDDTPSDSHYHQQIMALKDDIIRLKDSHHQITLAMQADFEQRLQQKTQHIATLEQRLIQQHADFEQKLQQEITATKKRSTTAQRSVIKGQISEQFVPFMAGFAYAPSDCQFLGKPVDYVVFHNLHRCSDGEVAIDDVWVVFLEVKSGRAKLGKRQEILKQAIARGQVRFETLMVKDGNAPTVATNTKNSTQAIATPPTTSYDQSWTPQADRQLLEGFDNGLDIDDLANLHQRNHHAIIARLKKLGRFE